MKQYLALILGLWVGVAQAQMTLACQFTMGNGFTWKNGQWQPQRFSPDNPFFLTIGPDNQLEVKSVLIAMGGQPEIAAEIAERNKSNPQWVKCFTGIEFAKEPSCSDLLGNSITVSLSSLEGAVSHIRGAAQEGNNRNDLRVQTFVCQKM